MIGLLAAAKAAGGLAALGAATLGYAGVIERNMFTLRRFTLPVLPPGARPVRILQVSDIHFVPGQARKARWIRDLAQLAPDIVVNSGDNLSHLEAVPGVLRALEPLMDYPGMFVLGSNDLFGPSLKNPMRYFSASYAARSGPVIELPTDDLVKGLLAGGWEDLNNARTSMRVAGQRLDFVGVDDPHIERDRYAAVSAPASPEAMLTVGLTHAPYQRVLNAMVADGAGLVVAGHTHGGQVAVPGYGALVTNCDLDTRRAKGLSRWWPGAGSTPSSKAPRDAAWLHVSAGLGTSRFAPIRFACRPEASLLTLTSPR